jgi:hypothetical protein
MKTYIFILLFGLFQAGVAQQANISISKHIKIKKFTEEDKKEIEKQAEQQGADLNEIYYLDDEHELHNELRIRIEETVSNNFPSIIAQIGSCSDLKVLNEKNEMSNFVMEIIASIRINEYNGGYYDENKELIRSQYHISFWYKIYDVRQNRIIHVGDEIKLKINTNGYLNAERLAQMFWDKFYIDALPEWNAQKLANNIKPKVMYQSAQIKYTPDDGMELKADGKNTGMVSVKRIKSQLKGEARKNTITQYKLVAEKGTFLETGTNEITFSGVDYEFEGFGGSQTFETRYKTYDCQNTTGENTGKEVFKLFQTQLLAEKIEHELCIFEQKFTCDPVYDITLEYHAPVLGKFIAFWEGVKIKIPSPTDKISEIDIQSIQNEGDLKQPKDKNGNPVNIPFQYTIPGVGKYTIYSETLNEFAIPRVTSIENTGMWNLSHNKSPDAINDFTIISVNDNDTKIEWAVDMQGTKGSLQMQFMIGTSDESEYEILGTNITEAWPVEFTPIKLNTNQLESLRLGDSLITLTDKENGNRAKIKITFMLQ